MAIYFVDSGGNDANDGLDNIGVNLSGTVIWTESSLTITEAAGHGYTFSAGDVLYASGGTGVTVGLYEVVSSTSTTIVLKETSTLLDVGNASDFAAGDLATGDITSSDGPLLTGDAAMNAVAAGDTAYLRSDQTYNELLTIDTAGTTTSAIRFVGYTTTLDDDGQSTIDAQSSRASCMADSLGTVGGYYVFENLIFINSTGSGVNVSLHALHFRNCEVNNTGGDGIQDSGNGLIVESCIFSGNSGAGSDGQNTCQALGCTFLTNGGRGCRLNHGAVIDCLLYSNSLDGIQFDGVAGFNCIAYGCTIDGDSKDTNTGIQFPASFWGPFTAINNIIYDCTTGIKGHNSGNHRFIGRNNLLNSNTTDYDNTGYRTEPGEVTSAPSFTNEGSQDYTLTSGSPATSTGFDAHEAHGSTQSRDMGCLQRVASAGGGLLSPNKRAGMQ